MSRKLASIRYRCVGTFVAGLSFLAWVNAAEITVESLIKQYGMRTVVHTIVSYGDGTATINWHGYTVQHSPNPDYANVDTVKRDLQRFNITPQILSQLIVGYIHRNDVLEEERKRDLLRREELRQKELEEAEINTNVTRIKNLPSWVDDSGKIFAGPDAPSAAYGRVESVFSFKDIRLGLNKKQLIALFGNGLYGEQLVKGSSKFEALFALETLTHDAFRQLQTHV